MNESLRYMPFETSVDTAFWHSLAKRKLDLFRLSTGPFPLSSEYSIGLPAGLNPRVNLDASSFPNTGICKHSTGSFKISGEVVTLNSLDEFRSVDKQQFINDFGTRLIKKALENNEYLKQPDMLLSFQLLTYLDLKQHKFYFWFAYPAVLHPNQPTLISSHLIDEEMSAAHLTQFVKSYDIWRQSHASAFFVVTLPSRDDPTSSVHVSSCADLQLGLPNVYLGFCDPSTDSKFPGWPLRNMLFVLSASLVEKSAKLRVICFRDRYSRGQRQYQHSIVLNVQLSYVEPSSINQFVGWEKSGGQLKPQMVNLSSSMDPAKLADSAVDLNLKLIKWRLMPDLKLDVFRDTKCLLIGAGTLGCNVARQLIAWGIRHITFVDNGNVSMSNPVRQSLYIFEDTCGDKKPKAVAASKALERIFPGVRASGIELSIPMPGHPVSSSTVITEVTNSLPKSFSESRGDYTDIPEAVWNVYLACGQLNDLIVSHDVVFLLTDTRESRWLPTLLCNVHEKLVINAALGFDTFLVMRHGLGGRPNAKHRKLWGDPEKCYKPCNIKSAVAKSIPGYQLGCYFCCDVVGPANSVQNRTLDQQCTVTRPGASMVASAFAVELLISVLQHQFQANAPAFTSKDNALSEMFPVGSSLHLVPHQIRGFLSYFNQILPATLAFKNCSACSSCVVNAFVEKGFEFLLRVFDDSNYLEEVAGLKELQVMADDKQVITLSDTE